MGDGNLCAMTVSGYEQGRAAGEMARGILIEGRSPSSYEFERPLKGDPVINTARANLLDIELNPTLVSISELIKDFRWE